MLLVSACLFGQDKDDSQSIYVITSSIEIFANKKSSIPNEEVMLHKGFGVEVNTFHGIFLFRTLSISLGAGIAFNINDDYKALPIVADVKWYLSEYGEESPYILLNAGRNLRINSFLGGQSSKFGIGYAFEKYKDLQYVMEFYVKSKMFILNQETGKNYQVDSIGIALGVKH